MKTIHIAEVVAEGGRNGAVEAAEGQMRVQLSNDEQPHSVTPEHLFAGAYAASFLDAIREAAESVQMEIQGATATGRAYLEEDERGGHLLDIDLRVTLPGVPEPAARHLLNLAHQSCPYSKATRGNIRVSLGVE